MEELYYTQSTRVYVPSLELGPPLPPRQFRKGVCLPPGPKGWGGGEHRSNTLLWVKEEVGGPYSDERTDTLVLSMFSEPSNPDSYVR
jgi:hypothetical protein